MSIFERACFKALRTRSRTIFATALLVTAYTPVIAADLKHIPVAEYVTLTPLARKASDGSTAEMEITYKPGQVIPPSFSFYVNGKSFTAKQVDKDQYSVRIPFEFDAFVKEQERRKALAPKLGKVPVFSGRAIVDHRPVRFLEPTELQRQIRDRKPIRVEPDVVRAFQGTAVPASSLVINDPSVVRDPTRTFNTCTGQGNPNGAWTFKRLMENIANESVTGINAAEMVEEWAQSFGITHTINSFPVDATVRASNLLDSWPRDLQNRLDLDQSPFLLLAIVNRVDLRKTTSYSPGGGGGEVRFVFNIIDRNTPLNQGGCGISFGTIILEYGVPALQCPAIQDYALQWGELSDIPLNTPEYRSALQAITDPITAANAAPHKANGSNLNQLRTNDFPIFSIWELREFHLNANTHLFETVSPALTPHFETFNNSFALGAFINQNQSQILLEQHQVPLSFNGAPFLTGSAMNPFQQQTTAKPWLAAGVTNPMARHKFALNTCNGCHGDETKLQGFRHISEAGLSQFMTGISFIPPGETEMVHFGELSRRQIDIESLIWDGCGSGNILTEVLLPVSIRTH